MSSPNTVAGQVGARLAVARRAGGLTLAALAGRTGLSVGYLSQLENGAANPTLATIESVAAALGLAVGSVFGSATDDAPLTTSSRTLPVVLRGLVPPPLGTEWIRDLSAPGSRLRTILLEGGVGDHGVPLAHEGEELCVVLSGDVDVEIEGVAHNLQEGDMAQFPADLPHRFALTSRASRLLVVIA